MPDQLRRVVSFLSRTVVPAMFAALYGLWPSFAQAVQFGELDVTSPLGSPLRAGFSVYPDPGETLSESCLRAVPPVGSGYPAISGVRLSVAGSAGDGMRIEVSAASVGEPVMRFAIAADCGAGKSLREYAVLALPGSSRAPAASANGGSTWLLAPGETPAGLAHTLFPTQPALQRRLLSAIAEMNPSLDIGDGQGPLPAGTPIVMPDWRRFAASDGRLARPSSGESAALSARRSEKDVMQSVDQVSGRARSTASPLRHDRVPEPQGVQFFRLARTLSSVPGTDERLREVLRLEYRLLRALNEQLSTMRPALADWHADAGRVPHVITEPAAGAVLRIDAAPDTSRLPAAATVADAALPSSSTRNAPGHPGAENTTERAVVAPSRPPTVSQSEVARSEGGDKDGLAYYVAAMGAALLAGVLMVRRRQRGAGQVAMPASIHEGETLILDHPPTAHHPTAVVAAGDGFSDEPLLTVAETPASSVAAGPQSGVDANPVLELAEIMLSFGRLQGAAQTLQEYIEANPKEALQPWIKLLEVYREGGMQPEYEALAEKLNGTYNVEVQRWDAVMQQKDLPSPVSDRGQEFSRVFTLEELPHIRERLVAEWGKPSCLDYLQRLLRDNRDGRRNGFTLPVVQEILFLIDVLVAREAP